MDSNGLLQTHAEVGIALAGFASVIAALSRPLSGLMRQRFLSLLALSLIQVLGCLLPLWCLHFFASPENGWRVLSGVLLVLNLARIWWLVLSPARDLGDDVQVVISPLVSKAVWACGFLALGFFLLNLVGVPFRPGFDLYYAGHLSTLLVGFALFADVTVAKS